MFNTLTKKVETIVPNVEGKIRKYYRTTAHGDDVLKEARAKAYELFKEMKE